MYSILSTNSIGTINLEKTPKRKKEVTLVQIVKVIVEKN